MAKPYRGRLIANEIVTLIDAIAVPEFPLAVSRQRLPKISKDELPEGSAVVTVAPLAKSGDEQDRESELLIYGLSVVVTGAPRLSDAEAAAGTEPAESIEADAMEDLNEQIQNEISDGANRLLTLNADDGEFDFQAELELPFINDPVYNLKMLREDGIYQSITVFNYTVERIRV